MQSNETVVNADLLLTAVAAAGLTASSHPHMRLDLGEKGNPLSERVSVGTRGRAEGSNGPKARAGMWVVWGGRGITHTDVLPRLGVRADLTRQGLHGTLVVNDVLTDWREEEGQRLSYSPSPYFLLTWV